MNFETLVIEKYFLSSKVISEYTDISIAFNRAQ